LLTFLVFFLWTCGGGGATATGFGIDGNGSIAITGSTKNDDDWDGFIVIVDDAGNRMY
jgi:hypothetical protein